MSVKKVVSELNLLPDKKTLAEIKRDAEAIVIKLREELKKAKIAAEVFVGGSFAKGTLIKGDFYDIDIFVRFGWKYENISRYLAKIVKKAAKRAKLKLETLHGSRDYFRMIKKEVIFEIVPVVKIGKPKEARNVTDLSYFHVNYVKRKFSDKLRKELVLAKQFCKAQKVYGAESYISGFSGYALECLIIHYNSFEKMLRELIKLRLGDRVIIDPQKAYKNKNDVVFEMNESKLDSPIILVDPTWKERNVLAALNSETFARFQEAARAFLKKPSKDFFIIKRFDENLFRQKARKSKAEFVRVELKTDRQPGDIAGTKMKKFANHLTENMSRYFDIVGEEFEYSGESKANLYLAAKSKKEIMRSGPPKEMDKAAKEFKKRNKGVFEKDDRLYSRIKINFTAKKFIKDFAKKFSKTVKAMGISGLRIN